MYEYDVFVSHAGEDKDDLVRPLAERLSGMGLRVWYDESVLKPGDSLRRSIDRGLSKSRFGVVVLSPSFFRKEWPSKELDALVALEDRGPDRIIPVWHQITRKQVAQHSPLLADRLAITSDIGVPAVAWAIYSKVTALQSLEAVESFEVLGPRVHEALLAPAGRVEPECGGVPLIQKDTIRDRRSYVREVLHLLADAADFSVLCMDGVLPYLFYGGTQESFRELRALECEQRATMMGLTPEVYSYWDAFWRAYRQGKSFRYSVGKASMDFFRNVLHNHLNRERALEVLARVETDLRLYSVDVRVSEILSPFCMFITDSTVLFAMISPRVSGLVARDGDLVGLYQQMFDLYYGNGTSIHSWIAGEKYALSGST
jgi:hypothetical protein